LSEHPDMDIYPSLISDKLHVSRSRVTAILTMLRKKGYVTLKMSENDRRRMLIKITAEGLAFIREKQKWADQHFDALVDGLGEKNTMELTRLVKISADIMEEGFLKDGDCKKNER
jgi:DNA-binding MarR family transcriptional regulator